MPQQDNTINGRKIIEMTMELPLCGLWTCDAVLPYSPEDKEMNEGDAATVALFGREFVGRISSIGVVNNRLSCRIVPGSISFGEVIEKRWYVDVPRRVPLSDVLSPMQLSSKSAAFLLSENLPQLAIPEGTRGEALGTLCSSATWRIEPDGTFLLISPGDDFKEEWMPSAPPTIIADDPSRSVMVLGGSDLSIMPGMLFSGRKVTSVSLSLSSSSFRAILRTQSEVNQGLVASLLKIVQKTFGRRMDYLAFYPAVILEQLGDGSLSLLPDDKRMKEMTSIPIMGEPWATYKIKPGSRCMVGFRGGNERMPYACQFEQGAITELTIKVDGTCKIDASKIELGGSVPFARMGDMVAIQLPAPLNAVFMGIIVSGSSNVGGT